ELFLNGNKLRAGDGAAVTETDKLEIESIKESRFLIFDMK
ncbi:MAG: pirin family protein, partial [Candidatus Dadabacteria bacterium]|nr:pirin family protein [Candidatus Dadabacteria bacterium]